MAAYKGVVATADYTFDKTAKTITFSANYTGIALSDIMYITNVKSATATVIYDPSNAVLGGSLSGLVLTLAYDTTAMSSADPLQIIVAMGTLASKEEVNGTLLEATATRSSSGTFFTQTITNYKWVNVQIDGIVNATLVFETSNDNSIWYFCVLSDISSTSGVIQANPSADSQYSGPISAKYFRVRTLSYVSGTITVTAEFSTLPTGQNASGVVSGQVGAKLLDHLGNGIDSNSTTYSSKRGLDVNVLGTLGTAFSTAGKVDVKAADGDVFVRQATASNLNATVVGTGSFVVQATLAAETTKVIGTINLASAQTLATLTSITNVVHVDDNSSSLTVDAPVGTPVFARLSDGSAALIGQKAMSASLPVVLASDQSSVSIKIDNTNPGQFNNVALQAQVDEAAISLIGENQYGNLRMTQYKALHIGIRDALGNDRGATVTASNELLVSVNNSSLAVTATLAAETTKVIGVVRNSDGAGNLLTSNSTTYTAKFGLDANLLGTLGTAFTTAGKVDVKGADGDVFVRQATAANFNATVVGTGTFAVQATLAAETTKVIGTINVAASQTIAVTNTGTFAVQATPVTQADTFMLGGVNVKEINAVTPLMGSGIMGTGSLRVTIASDNDPLIVKQATAANLNATVVGTGTFVVQSTPAGNVAHDSVDSGNPVKVGAKAIASLKTTTLVSGADRTDNQSDLDGALLVRNQIPLGDLISERLTDTGGSSTVFSNFTAVASTKNYVTAITVYNSSATAGFVDIRDGTAGAILWTMPLPAGGGSTLANGGNPLFKNATANTALAYDVSGALTTVYISMSGFQSKV
jgi:hypothetical protein